MYSNIQQHSDRNHRNREEGQQVQGREGPYTQARQNTTDHDEDRPNQNQLPQIRQNVPKRADTGGKAYQEMQGDMTGEDGQNNMRPGAVQKKRTIRVSEQQIRRQMQKSQPDEQDDETESSEQSFGEMCFPEARQKNKRQARGGQTRGADREPKQRYEKPSEPKQGGAEGKSKKAKRILNTSDRTMSEDGENGVDVDGTPDKNSGHKMAFDTQQMTYEDAYSYKLSTPISLTNFMVNKSGCMIFLAFMVMLGISIISVSLGWMSTSDPSERDYLVWGADVVNDFDKSRLISQELKRQIDKNEVVPLQSQIESAWSTIVVYNSVESESQTSTLWTKQNLIAIREFEKELLALPKWPNLCFAKPITEGNTEDVACAQGSFSSALDLFDDPSKLETMTDDEIIEVLRKAISDKQTWIDSKAMFDNMVTEENLQVTYMRCLMTLAGPIKVGSKRYETLDDDFKKQREEVTDFQIEVRSLCEKKSIVYAMVERRPYGNPLFNVIFRETLDGDVYYSVFSVMFVLFYIWLHLESFFMALISMVLILLSFPVTQFIYAGILQIPMNTTLNQLTIFIVLGIAADDIFVFCDAWKQSKQIHFISNDLHRRMAYSFKRSFKAIAVTSSTTSIAFLSNALSDIRPIRAFGIFAALIIPVNFLIVILVMPPVQVIHDVHIKEKCSYKRLFRRCCGGEDEHENQQQMKKPKAQSRKDSRNKLEQGGKSKQKSSEASVEMAQPDRITKCMGGPFNSFVRRHRFGLVFLLFFIGIGAIIVASFIGPLTEDSPMLPDDHPLTIMQNLLSTKFTTTSNEKEAFIVNIVWGVKGLDRDDTALWDPEDLGKLIWDDEFTVAPAENQQAVLNMCSYLREQSPLVKDQQVYCWIEDMDLYVQQKTGGAKQLPLEDSREFNDHLRSFAFESETGKQYVESQQLGFNAESGRLMTMKIMAQAIGQARAPRSEKLPKWQAWEDYLDDFAATAPPGLENVFQHADVFWSFMESEHAFYKGAIQGMIVSISLAFFIMLLSTRNCIVTVYAIIAVIFIVANITAVMVIAGWELGVPESVATVIVIGFSVDYVVHLAAHYVHSPFHTRAEKATESVAAMGVSIYSGAVTTLGSGVFLFGGTLIFFQKFGLVIVMTVLCSLIYALIYFLAVLHAFGPNGKLGDVIIFWRACVETCRESSELEQGKSQQTTKGNGAMPSPN